VHHCFSIRASVASNNLRAVDLVTADGQCLTASATEHPDLFWGVRGGGGKFGIVTSFEYQLHPVGPALGGMLIYPFAQAKAVLQFHRDFISTAPNAYTSRPVGCTSTIWGRRRMRVPSGCRPPMGRQSMYGWWR
jgi:FAD/FMN-containing dehydrogenase